MLNCSRSQEFLKTPFPSYRSLISEEVSVVLHVPWWCLTTHFVLGVSNVKCSTVMLVALGEWWAQSAETPTHQTWHSQIKPLQWQALAALQNGSAHRRPLFVPIPTASRRESQIASNYKILTMIHLSRPKSKLNTQPLRQQWQKLDGNICLSNIKLQSLLPCPCLPLKLQASTNSFYWLWRNLPLLNRVQLYHKIAEMGGVLPELRCGGPGLTWSRKLNLLHGFILILEKYR